MAATIAAVVKDQMTYRTKSHCPILIRPSVIPRRVPWRIKS
jgi:hypothetical protein